MENQLAAQTFGPEIKLEEQLIRLKVNGQERTFDGDPDMPLLWYLRDVAGLTGTKFGCGMALCGACTVHQNGQAIRSCSTTMRQVAGAEIITIEGVEPLHPVQKAWMEIRVPQCGYCQTGQIMTAIALLKTNKTPSDQDIDVAMSGNLCRCGTYQRIRAAIHQAAKELAAKNGSAKELTASATASNDFAKELA
jgi:isoquinoline 1-oxidoreductase subunit alpha